MILLVVFENYKTVNDNYRNSASINVTVDIPSPVITRVVADEIYTQTWLGIEGINVDGAIASSAGLKRVSGILINKVVRGSPAYYASDNGLKRGDILVNFNRRLVKDVAALKGLIAKTEPGDMVRMEIVRDGDKSSYYVQMELRPSNAKIVQIAGTAFENKDQGSFKDDVTALFNDWGLNALAVLVILLTLHYIIFGPLKVEKKSNRVIQRFTLNERVMKFHLMASFILLCLLGFVTAYIDKKTLVYLRGENLITVHIIVGALFAFSLLWMAFRWFKHMYYFDDYDVQWLKNLGGYLHTRGNKKEYPTNKFNPGQKLFYWFTVIMGTVVVVSGFMLIKDYAYLFTYNEVNLARRVHLFSTYLLLLGVVSHLYLVLFANPGVIWAIISGRVKEDFAKAHHLIWFKGKKHSNEIREKNITARVASEEI